MVTVIGGNSRMVRRKDMEHLSGLMDTDTSGNSWMMSSTSMEYKDGLMEEYITESGNRIRWMGKDITGGQVAMNIGESTRMTRNGEREYSNRVEYFTETNTKKATASVGVKYSELIKSLIRN
jgi:hypothetical protein